MNNNNNLSNFLKISVKARNIINMYSVYIYNIYVYCIYIIYLRPAGDIQIVTCLHEYTMPVDSPLCDEKNILNKIECKVLDYKLNSPTRSSVGGSILK